MGDLIELTTWPKHPNVFYKMTGSGFCFDVKAPGYAGIGLARKAGKKCDVLVALGFSQHSWIKKANSSQIKKCETRNILSADEYRTFWISWNAGCVRLGRGEELKAIVTLNCQMHDIQYVTFCAIGERHPVHWKFTVSPIIERPKLESITGGELHWVQVDSESPFPDDALIAGCENENLYIIRAQHRGSLTPGKFVSSEGLGYISWGGAAHEKNSFEVLCGFDCIWVPSHHGQIPVGAVVGGHAENENRETLYIGRVRHNNHLIPGKVQASHRVCYIPFGDAEVPNNHYEILVCPQKTHVANKILAPHLDLSDWIENHDNYHMEIADDDDDEDNDDEDNNDENNDGGGYDDNHFNDDDDDEAYLPRMMHQFL